MREITDAQKEVLKALWLIDEGAITDIVNEIKEPKPAYTTIATVIKVLEKKGYVAHKSFGKTNVYYPLVSKKQYGQYVVSHNVKELFNSSVSQLISAFVSQKKVGLKELEELKKIVELEIEKQKRP
jgi:BlaI family penicillinase repressor